MERAASAVDKFVLIVDDTPEICELVELVLTGAGYRAMTASNGLVGLEMVKELRPDVVLLDMMMPELDGLEFLTRLAQEVEPPRPIVIAVSGFDAFKDEALKRGARAFIRKPLGGEELLLVLDSVLRDEAGLEDTVQSNLSRTSKDRALATQDREALLNETNLDNPELQKRMCMLTVWCAGYFGVGKAIVNIQRGKRTEILAATGPLFPAFECGTDLPCETMFCSRVVKGQTPLILPDTSITVFAKDPTIQAGFAFYAGVPLRTPRGIVLGTLCIVHSEPGAVHAEDISILEIFASHIARLVEALAGYGRAGPFAFVAPDVTSKNVFRSLISAELSRINRDGGGMELGLIDIGATDRALLQRAAQAIGIRAMRLRLGIGEFGPGVIGIVIGAGSLDIVQRRMTAALDALHEEKVPIRGGGIVAYEEAGPPLFDVRSLETLADEIRARTVGEGLGVVERASVSLGVAASQIAG
jgi:DNA-binding response OmpR family regulator